jgi:hypothetical protein
MNEPKPNAIAIDSETLDRLVDGELSPAEYRRVLQALEQQPGAWRKCAEAFLQAQAWQLDMQEVRAAAEVKPVVSPKTEVPPRASLTGEWLRMLLVAAASFLLAFFGARSYWQAQEHPLRPAQPTIAQPANGQQQLPKQVTPQNLAQDTQRSGNQPLGKVQLVVNRPGGDDSQLVDVPVYDDAAATEVLRNSRPALPEDLIHELEAKGHQVVHQRQLVPVPVSDGQQMIVPVEGYRILPRRRPSY